MKDIKIFFMAAVFSVVLVLVPFFLTAVSKAEEQIRGNGRIVVRASGTEPLLRIYCEATNKNNVQKILKMGENLFKSSMIGLIHS